MIYQVRANLYFVNQDEANDFYHDCELALPKSTSINPAQVNAEVSKIEMLENHHDQDPTQPCDLIKADTVSPP